MRVRRTRSIGVSKTTLLASFPRPIAIPVPVFNLVPEPGEPARFGFEVLDVPVILDTAVRTGGDYGVVVSVSNISQAADLLASQVTFWGDPGDPRHNQQRGWNCLPWKVRLFGNGSPCEPLSEASSLPLLTLPTSCATPWIADGLRGLLAGTDGAEDRGIHPARPVRARARADRAVTG